MKCMCSYFKDRNCKKFKVKRIELLVVLVGSEANNKMSVSLAKNLNC